MALPMLILDGRKYVLVPAEQYVDNLTPRLPAFPPADRDGNVPAVAYARVSIAREIIQRRESLGLTQAQLARNAHIPLATLNRIERAKVTATERTIVKIERALTHVNPIKRRTTRSKVA